MFRSFFGGRIFFSIHAPQGRHKLARRLSHGGRYIVRFVSFPQCPDVCEFIDRAKRVRYINMDARPGANISQLI